tara:strand:- start:189 stop:329 length:141 start_codon:yes stop_codon:yes gene_type:complete
MKVGTYQIEHRCDYLKQKKKLIVSSTKSTVIPPPLKTERKENNIHA